MRLAAAFPVIPDVRRIAVLRGGHMGDLLLTLPALRSLKDTYPAATLTLLAAPRNARLLAGRAEPVDEVLALPVSTGVYEPRGAAEDPAALGQFFADARRRRFDLAVQLHGGGRFSNPFLRKLAATVTIGSRSEDAEPLDRWLPFRPYQHETMRALEVVGLAGAPVTALEPLLTALAADLATADRVLAGLPPAVVAVHPGAMDPRRRWPAERFAEVMAAVVRDGAGAAVIGSADEADLVRQVVSLTHRRLPAGLAHRVRPLGGALDESALVGVLARSAVLLGNDSGPRHLAAAVGTATVAVFWIGNMINFAPLTRTRHRVHVAWITACPACGQSSGPVDAERCEHDVSFVIDVDTAPVLADLRALLDGQ